MAGRPKLRELEARIARLAAKHEHDSATEYVAALVADGATWKDLTKRFETNNFMLDNWIDLEPGRRAIIDRARKLAARVVFDEAGEILDDAQEMDEAHHVTAAKNRATHRERRAALLNRDEFGDRPTTAVQFNIGALFMDAVKQVVSEMPTPQALPPAVASIEDAEYVIECTQADTLPAAPEPVSLDDICS